MRKLKIKFIFGGEMKGEKRGSQFFILYSWSSGLTVACLPLELLFLLSLWHSHGEGNVSYT